MMQRAKPGDAGFTLVELLVVLAILGLLGGLLAVGLRSASEGWQRIVRHNEESEELLSINRMLRQLFSEIYPQRTGDSLRSPVRFAGHRDRMEFLAPLPQRLGRADIVLYDMQLQSDGVLHLSWRFDRPTGQENGTPSMTEARLSGLSGARLSYFGPSEAGSLVKWWDSWLGRRSRPLLVRIRFVWHGSPEELIVAPRLNGASCLVNGMDAPCMD